jgi:DNA-binding NtrC family response regulator
VWLRLYDARRFATNGASFSCVARETLLRPGEEVVVGSSASARLITDDVTVSRLHARIAHEGGVVSVTDLGSRNGVCVAGVRVARALLPVGGVVELGKTVMRVEAMRDESGDSATEPLPGMIGSSPAMRALASSVRRIAQLRLPVLLRGPSGAGKDLVARAIHTLSTRSRGPFIALNAAAIPREMAESELFGHLRGAFTGAQKSRKGAFQLASGGTLFLDEIAALTIDNQAKLLRAVEEGVVRPLGGELATPFDARLIAATCEPLETMVSEKAFRHDLYERLAVCVVNVPSLAERSEDIGPLARHLLVANELSATLSRDALVALRAHPWPGNVRELRNVLVQASVLARDEIRGEHIAAVLRSRAIGARARMTPDDARRLYESADKNQSLAARHADLPRSTFRDLLARAGKKAPAG